MARTNTTHHSGLNAKQRVFCEQYVIDLNATQAAIRAGYSKKTAGQIGDENLKKPQIATYIHFLKEKRSEATKITSERVLQELANIAFGNINDLLIFDKNGIRLKSKEKLTDAQLGIISELNLETTKKNGKSTTNTKIKLYPKDNALVNLMRHLGMFEKDNSQQGKEIKVIIKKKDK